MIPQPGCYQVCLDSSPSRTHATNTPMLIKHAKGNTKLTVDQDHQTPLMKWSLLGEFEFKAGSCEG